MKNERIRLLAQYFQVSRKAGLLKCFPFPSSAGLVSEIPKGMPLIKV